VDEATSIPAGATGSKEPSVPAQPNIQQLLKQAQQMQKKMAQAQAELAEIEVTGTAGGGLVTIAATGAGEYRSVSIDPRAVDPDDVETLEDLVLAALTNTAEAVREVAEKKMGPISGGLPGLPL
jgi:DNA-binding YbaB/EbfC family protein